MSILLDISSSYGELLPDSATYGSRSFRVCKRADRRGPIRIASHPRMTSKMKVTIGALHLYRHGESGNVPGYMFELNGVLTRFALGRKIPAQNHGEIYSPKAAAERASVSLSRPP